jgi:nitrile hydratase
MHGFGPVVREAGEPVFHHDWERRVFALTLAAGALGRWNLDMSRAAREQMPPAEYLATTYYEHWLFGLVRLLVERGLVTPRELETGRADGPAEGARILRPDGVERMLGRRSPGRLADSTRPARFHVGDRVVARNVHPVSHTRLPRYARGRQGVVSKDHGVFVFPDSRVLGLGDHPQHVYSVRFVARELWGEGATAQDAVYIDLWDEYLDRA